MATKSQSIAPLFAVVHTYQFDTSKPAGLAAFKELHATLSAIGLTCMETCGGGSHIEQGRKVEGKEVRFDLGFVFDNQWNTAPIDGVSDLGLRLHDWAQDYRPGNSITLKQGYWIEQTDGMREVRRNTLKCGYCGHMEQASKGLDFCPACIGNQHLEVKDLHLTRLLPLTGKQVRAELTEAERARLVPLWREAKLHGNTAREKAALIKQRADHLAKCDKACANAVKERDGFIWMMDNGIRTSNAIFYTHTGRFGFGWSQPVSAELLGELKAVLIGAPFEYDIVCTDGRKLACEDLAEGPTVKITMGGKLYAYNDHSVMVEGGDGLAFWFFHELAAPTAEAVTALINTVNNGGKV